MEAFFSGIEWTPTFLLKVIVVAAIAYFCFGLLKERLADSVKKTREQHARAESSWRSNFPVSEEPKPEQEALDETPSELLPVEQYTFESALALHDAAKRKYCELQAEWNRVFMAGLPGALVPRHFKSVAAIISDTEKYIQSIEHITSDLHRHRSRDSRVATSEQNATLQLLYEKLKKATDEIQTQ